jgi:DNA sulfur modification protein DndD
MIFEEVRIHNLFSYRGEQIFDFRGANPNRNIALVYGRNGYGKTSFLNALRLLFLGPTNELRDAVQTGRKVGPNQYILV